MRPGTVTGAVLNGPPRVGGLDSKGDRPMSDKDPVPRCAHRNWQQVYLAILPTLRNCVAFAFRHVPAEEQEELIQEALANASVACARLVAQGRADRIFPTALAS